MAPAARAGRVRPILAVLALVLALLLLRALTGKLNHDESQYIAGAMLADGRLIYRDYLSLQTPLHAWLFAPLALAWPTGVHAAMRVTTALLGVATVALAHRAALTAGAPPRAALAAAALLACVEAFQFAGSVVRNDMLPALFAMAALWAALAGAARGDARWWLAAGIGFGLAASTKLSYAPFLAAGGLLLLTRDARALAGFGGGAILGLLPAAAGWASAPATFGWGVVRYGAEAPFQWYRLVGRAHELTLANKAVDLLGHIAQGPAMPALVLVAITARAAWREPRGRLLLTMLAAGAIGAALPTPTHRPYLVPLLVPLFVALGPALARVPAAGRRRTAAVLALFAIAGVFFTFKQAARGRSPVLAADAQARWIGDRLRAERRTGAIAGFAPDRVASARYPIDERFAVGPFVFRSGALLRPEQARAFNTVIPATLAADLDARPPAAILTGYEARRWNGVAPPDAYLERYARQRGYRALTLPDGVGRLLLPPVGEPSRVSSLRREWR